MNREFEDLEKRIRRLELQNRRLRWLGVMFVALAMTTAAWAQKTGSQVMQAQKFELRDDAGRLRAELAILEGGPTLRFFAESGDVQSLLAEDSYTIFKKGGDIQAVFAFNGLSFEDGHDKVFVSLTADEEGQGGKLKLNDYRHKVYTVINAQDLAKVRAANKAR
jgi:hypothetical protein